MTDERRRLAEQWAASRLGWPRWSSEALASDASFRRYFRLRHAGRSYLVMDAPPQREAVGPFVEIAGRLRAAGVHAPEVLASDPDTGLVLLEDLGRRPYHHALDEASATPLMQAAIDTLVLMQTHTDTRGLPHYDPALLLGELALFVDWFLTRHWQVQPTEQELDGWDHVCANLLRWALDQPRVFCHRDFMPRNLIVSEPNPGVIDFQDAVIGPISYDPVCLFRDAFLSWPPARVDSWLENYRRAALAAGLPLTPSAELWRRTCDMMGVQRHLKVIGIFARIRYRDGKPHYLDDLPRFMTYLDAAIARNPELSELELLLAAWKQRCAP